MSFLDRFKKHPARGATELDRPVTEQPVLQDLGETSAPTPEAAQQAAPVQEELTSAATSAATMATPAPAEPAPSTASTSTPAGSDVNRLQSIPEQRFSLEDTSRIAQLMELGRETRDGAWVLRFQEAAWNASMVLPAEPVFLGPDGMPYVRLELPPVGQPVETNCLSNIFASLAEQGLGAAFFKNATDTPELAEYVMPTGVLESLRAYGTWDGDPVDAQEMAARPPQPAAAGGMQETQVEKERQVMVGPPSEAYLPRHTARLLYRHLTEGWKMEDPRVALVVDEEMTPSRNLVIGRKFSEFPDREVASRATQMLLWYFPPRRYLLLMPENWTLDQMRPLKELC